MLNRDLQRPIFPKTNEKNCGCKLLQDLVTKKYETDPPGSLNTLVVPATILKCDPDLMVCTSLDLAQLPNIAQMSLGHP